LTMTIWCLPSPISLLISRSLVYVRICGFVVSDLKGNFFVPLQSNAGHGLLILEVYLDHTQRRSTVGRTPLDEWSARRIDLYLTTHNTHNRQTPMPPVGFEPTISAGERSQSYALDRAATGNQKMIKIVELWKEEQ
jgi:hypothetical protein